ncbi:hypothetical protein Sgly_0589 [Syntrophobotulus glycolicus DSM 8271]|uniref:FlgN family protein n=1 Tax=Syntrophobotulus glycolicus (strain DSM 8271 / FlGlyR) TaxID=645991 RepID=F0SZE7_SYNGF|nr:hypothetical protein [Syntrophobotulus glycolicus]ADY54952.1 hypothetical protein Sgly_0589 [Syntrophobotulus glycolicus DSM 8271]
MSGLLGDLEEYYLRDLEDYRQLLEFMRTFEEFLDKEQSRNTDGISSQESDESEETQRIVEMLRDFSQKREEWFAVIMARRQDSDRLKNQLKKKGEKPDKLFDSTAQLNILTKEILAIDESVIAKIKMEMEFVKNELNRLRSGKKAKNVYGQNHVAEARFIDKIK